MSDVSPLAPGPVVGQAVGAPVPDCLEAEAGAQGEVAQQQPVLDEGRVGLVLAAVVLDDPALACERRVAVLLPALLDLEVGADADLGLAAQAEQADGRAQARLDPEVVEVAQAALVPAGGKEVGHAAAGGIDAVVRPLAGVARLAPPVAAEARTVDLVGEDTLAADEPGVAGRGAQPPAVEGVVLERVLARVRLPLARGSGPSR